MQCTVFILLQYFGMCIVHLINILENRPIMLAQCLMLLLTYHAWNYAGIIGASLLSFHEENDEGNM